MLYIDLNTVNKNAYLKFYPQLVKLLPMRDATFVANLVQLLPGDFKEKMQSKPTQAEAAAFFLDNEIAPALEYGENKSFNILLTAIELFDSIPLSMLAQEIKIAIQEALGNSSVAGE